MVARRAGIHSSTRAGAHAVVDGVERVVVREVADPQAQPRRREAGFPRPCAPAQEHRIVLGRGLGEHVRRQARGSCARCAARRAAGIEVGAPHAAAEARAARASAARAIPRRPRRRSIQSTGTGHARDRDRPGPRSPSAVAPVPSAASSQRLTRTTRGPSRTTYSSYSGRERMNARRTPGRARAPGSRQAGGDLRRPRSRLHDRRVTGRTGPTRRRS